MEHWKTLDEARAFWFVKLVNTRQQWHKTDHKVQRCSGNGSDTKPWSVEKFDNVCSESEGDPTESLWECKEQDDSSTWWEEDSNNECLMNDDEEEN